jgi:hypothetical protein
MIAFAPKDQRTPSWQVRATVKWHASLEASAGAGAIPAVST